MEGLRTHDVLIKGGEWKLGSNEEPKPFQTVRVRKITMHPAYQPTNLESDIALLHLENDLKFDKHIGPICIDESELEPTGSDEECVTSGWGKEIIKCKCICTTSQLAASVKSVVCHFIVLIELFEISPQITLLDHYLIHLQSIHCHRENAKARWVHSIQIQPFVDALKEIHVMSIMVALWLVHAAMDATC